MSVIMTCYAKEMVAFPRIHDFLFVDNLRGHATVLSGCTLSNIILNYEINHVAFFRTLKQIAPFVLLTFVDLSDKCSVLRNATRFR